jgi:hypothetical protein
MRVRFCESKTIEECAMQNLRSFLLLLISLVTAIASGPKAVRPVAAAAEAAGTQATPNSAAGPVSVFVWFDTEDYILPQSDDALKRVADFLTRNGIRGTFKMVAEKSRVLERRGRKDVLASLLPHEIGYHTDTHSQHPTLAEFEEPLDWRDGVEEFTRRERAGFEDLRRIHGQTPSCYGQPGGSWAPQILAALKQWGVNVYIDEAPDIGLDGNPFWYAGILNIFNTTYGFKLRPNDDFSNLEGVKALFQKVYAETAAQPGGGIISVHFHPCEFVHTEFWDGVNFAHGADPPPSEWKLPRTKTPEASEKAFGFFEGFVRYMKSFPVQFVTASHGLNLYPDLARNRSFSRPELAEIARRVRPEISFQTHGAYALSPSEVLLLLNRYVADFIQNKPDAATSLDSTPYGPSRAAVQLTGRVEVPWYNFSRTALDVSDALAKTGQVPYPVWVGSTPVPPECYLSALAGVAARLLDGGKVPASVTVGPATLATTRYVAKDSQDLWDWPIYHPGFNGKHILELARLQTWTLKPAILRTSIRPAGN